MAVLVDFLPDDAATLKAMLIAERARTERLTQIIKELQRHRFGRRAESLPIDHYGVLASIEEALGLPLLGGAADRHSGRLDKLFAAPPRIR